LTGDDRRANSLLAEAIQAAPQSAVLRLHAAIVQAALGQNEPAQQQLTRALELDPKLAGTEEVQQLRGQLKIP
jgi:Tfp pilus assembly protein PilF